MSTQEPFHLIIQRIQEIEDLCAVHPELNAYALFFRVNLHRRAGEHGKGLQLLRQLSANSFEGIEPWVTLALYWEKAATLYELCHFSEALDAASDHIRACEQIAPRFATQSYYLVAGMMLHQEDAISALEIFTLLRDRTPPDETNPLNVNIHFGLGVSYRDLRDFDRSRYHLEEALRIGAVVPNESVTDQARFELGLLYAQLGDLATAIEIIDSTILSMKSRGWATHSQEILKEIVIGEAGDAGKSLSTIELLLKELQGNKAESVRIQSLVLYDVANLYEKTGRYEDAFRCRQMRKAIDKTLTDTSLKQRLASTRFMLALERERRAEEIRELRTEFLESELRNTTQSLLAQTELLANFRDDIRALVRKLPPTDPVIKELKEKLKALPCESVDWERFDAQFKAAHPDFIKNLTTAHPDLTSMEVRICSLLRSSLKSQDIGRLLCLSDRTVENHRFNIRKKLALARSIDLKVYLQRF